LRTISWEIRQSMTTEEMSTEGMCTVAEASSFLSLSKSMVYQLMDKGDLAYAKFGKARRIPRKALVRFAGQSVVERSR
jgi:excisionase family DNA binding protein